MSTLRFEPRVPDGRQKRIISSAPR
jgi:hypothetical protein